MVLRLSSNMIGNSDDETNFPHELWLINKQVANIYKAFAKCYQNEPRFNGVYSRDNPPNKIKDGTYVINLDEYHDIGTH